MANNATITMDDLLAGDSVKQLTAGEVITGTILSVRKHEVLVDLGAQGVGVGFQQQCVLRILPAQINQHAALTGDVRGIA